MAHIRQLWMVCHEVTDEHQNSKYVVHDAGDQYEKILKLLVWYLWLRPTHVIVFIIIISTTIIIIIIIIT